MPFAATWMGLEVIIPSEVSQRNVPNNVTCMQNLKYDTNELIYKAETDSQTQRMNLWLQRGRVWGGIVREFGNDIYTILYLKWITNKDLLYSAGNSAQYYVIA